MVVSVLHHIDSGLSMSTVDALLLLHGILYWEVGENITSILPTKITTVQSTL